MLRKRTDGSLGGAEGVGGGGWDSSRNGSSDGAMMNHRHIRSSERNLNNEIDNLNLEIDTLEEGVLTPHVATRWYRAPEVTLPTPLPFATPPPTPHPNP